MITTQGVVETVWTELSRMHNDENQDNKKQ